MHDIFSNKIWQLWMPLLTTLPLSQPASKKRELPLVCFRTTETHQANFHKLFSLIYTVLSLMDSLGLLLRKFVAFYYQKIYTVLPHIVSALEQFPPLNSFCTFMYCDLWPLYCDLWISKFKKEQFVRKLYEEIQQIFYWNSRWYTKLCCQTLAQNMSFLFSMISSYFPLTRETYMKEFLQNF